MVHGEGGPFDELHPGGAGRRLLRLLFGTAVPLPAGLAGHVHDGVEGLGVIGAGVSHRVDGQVIEPPSAQLLQPGLVVLAARTDGGLGDPRPEEAHDEILGGVPSLVDVDRSDDRLGGVRQYGRLLPAPGGVLTLAEQQGDTEAELQGHVGQRRGVDDRGPDLGQLPFRQVGIGPEQELGDDEAENRIAQELEAFVGPDPGVFGAPRPMRQRLDGQRNIANDPPQAIGQVADPPFDVG